MLDFVKLLFWAYFNARNYCFRLMLCTPACQHPYPKTEKPPWANHPLSPVLLRIPFRYKKSQRLALPPTHIVEISQCAVLAMLIKEMYHATKKYRSTFALALMLAERGDAVTKFLLEEESQKSSQESLCLQDLVLKK